MKNISFTEDQIKQIYEVSYTISESRGKARQNIINEKFTCICGGKYTYSSKSKHEKTLKHQNALLCNPCP
jgi:hypothetical protein